MFSGKTTELLRRLQRYKVAGRGSVVLKPVCDTRYSETEVVTHEGLRIRAYACQNLTEAAHLCLGSNIIGIDEGQFFPDLIAFCDSMVDAGHTVVVAALSGTYERKPFGQVCDLVPRADEIVHLTAMCRCGQNAPFTARTTDETETTLIGGADKYIPCCTDCWVAIKQRAPPSSGE